MTLDECPPVVEHAALRAHYEEPVWLRMARRQEAAAAAEAEREWREREEIESPDAMATYWEGVMRQMPDHVRRTRYEGDHG